MADQDVLADRFELERRYLRSVAYRILGSSSDAEDAVQEAWLRLSRTDVSDVANLRGWLTTVVSRVALTMLHSRRPSLELADVEATHPDPEERVVLTDEVGAALQVVLRTLEPRQRLAFVLHDLFDVPFDDIGPIVDATPAAARQLASRARRRVRSADVDPAAERNSDIVRAFLDAARNARFDELLLLLDPDVVLRADAAAVRLGAAARVDGAAAVARAVTGRAQVAELAVIDGQFGAVWFADGRPRVAFRFGIGGQRIVALDLVADSAGLAELVISPIAAQQLLGDANLR